MNSERSDGRRGSGRSSMVRDALGRVVDVLERGVKVGSDEGPSSHVLGLLLCPADLGVGVELELREDVVEGEGSELFHADESDVLEVCLPAGSEELVVDLSAAEDELLDLVWRVEVLVHLWDDMHHSQVVPRVVKVFYWRDTERITEESLWTHHHERLAELP